MPWGLRWKYVQMWGGLADEGLSCTSQESVRFCLKTYPDRRSRLHEWRHSLETLKHLFPLGKLRLSCKLSKGRWWRSPNALLKFGFYSHNNVMVMGCAACSSHKGTTWPGLHYRRIILGFNFKKNIVHLFALFLPTLSLPSSCLSKM